jgi:hypothetical protein
LEGLEAEDPGAVLELVTMMEFGIVGLALEPHFVDDFEPALRESANGVGVRAIFGAVVVIIALGPEALLDALFSE